MTQDDSSPYGARGPDSNPDAVGFCLHQRELKALGLSDTVGLSAKGSTTLASRKHEEKSISSAQHVIEDAVASLSRCDARSGRKMSLGIHFTYDTMEMPQGR